MDKGLAEAIALAASHAKRPLAIEVLIWMARQCQGIARHAQAQATPDPAAVKRCMEMALDAGQGAVPYLRPGGELRRRLESGELMSEEEWHRLCGP
jgi:hypothetical protein